MPSQAWKQQILSSVRLEPEEAEEGEEPKGSSGPLRGGWLGEPTEVDQLHIAEVFWKPTLRKRKHKAPLVPLLPAKNMRGSPFACEMRASTLLHLEPSCSRAGTVSKFLPQPISQLVLRDSDLVGHFEVPVPKVSFCLRGCDCNGGSSGLGAFVLRTHGQACLYGHRRKSVHKHENPFNCFFVVVQLTC